MASALAFLMPQVVFPNTSPICPPISICFLYPATFISDIRLHSFPAPLAAFSRASCKEQWSKHHFKSMSQGENMDIASYYTWFMCSR